MLASKEGMGRRQQKKTYFSMYILLYLLNFIPGIDTT